MAERSNVWGGSFEINPDDAEFQSSTPPPRDDDDVKQGWLLRPEDHQNGKRRKKMKKRNRNGMNMNRLVLYTLLVVVILAVFISVLVVVVTRRHRKVSLPPPDNYTDALKKALMFFNAQRSGKLTKDNNVTWRGDSGLNDGRSDFINDLVGGYYDGGDATKYTFPTSFSMAILSWSVLEYSQKYQAVSELKHVKSIIKWGTDYLLKTFNSSGETTDRIVLKVGGDNDRVCWMRPENMDSMRKTESCFECRALAAETAAALAAASIVFKDDYNYSKKLVNGAENVYKFAVEEGHGKKNNGASSGHYDSSGHWDEFLWGGTWLYYATGKSIYLSLVTEGTWAKNDPSYQSGPDHSVFSWDHKLPGAMLLLTRLRIFLQYGYPYEEWLGNYHQKITDAVCSYLPVFHNFNRTRGGLIQLNHGKPQPLQYVVNAAFLATLFSDYLNNSLTPGFYCAGKLFLNDELRQFARSQIDYILGKNPQKMSYIVGFGEKFPKKVYHRGASIPKNGENNGCKGSKWKNSTNPNPNVIVGALVAGPDRLDGFQDDRSNYNYTEPTIAGNAGLIAALVALSGENTTPKIDKNTLFHAIPPLYTPDPPPPPPPSIP